VFCVLWSCARENKLPMALAVMVFAWSLDVPASTLWKPRQWLEHVWRPALIAMPVALVIGMSLFALRTWHYTGKFTLLFGSQINALAVWQPGMSLREGLTSMLSSVMMVAATTDPPRYHTGAIPFLAGTALSVAALIGLPFARRLPFAAVMWTMSGFVSYLIARGTAYSGRFSVHIVGSTIAVLTCALAALFSRYRESEPSQDPTRANRPA
jgi:hypothetical protein